MSDEQTIYIGPQDDLTNVRERLERIPARRVTLVIPSQTLLRALIAWRNLYARAQELGKEVLIISSDPQVRSVAQGAKFKVTSLEELQQSTLERRQARKAALIGQQFGGYRLTHQLGGGSIGDVYLGEHVDLGTKAAIKVLRSHIDEVAFQNGVRRIARLIHPNIVRTVESGVKDNMFFLVMDYVPHGTLKQRHSNDKTLPLITVVEYVKLVAAALQEAHDHNVLLGNVRPENMLVGDNNEVLLTGFDTVLMESAKRGNISIGQYTAPEQAKGNILPASDQYALAAIVYEWLSGKPPVAFSPSENDADKAKRLAETFPTPLRTLVPALSQKIEDVVTKALAKDPKQRFASVKAFATALEQANLPSGETKPPKLVGQRFGNYDLISVLGTGSFADVYLGKHSHMNTSAAIKILHTRLTDEDVERFRDEARMIARLKHRHIVRVLDFGVEDKIPFLVMDHAPNGTLRDRHARGSVLPKALILLYVQQVAAALQYAHDQKIIHRDIKPENILIGSNNEILLSDFGIAVIGESSRDQRKNKYDVAGSIAYMAPEQIQGHPHRNSDQYALGVIVYEWLCGTRPFNGPYLEVAIQHERALPTPLYKRNPSISPDIEQVVMIALAKDPQRRFRSIQAFANSLEQACK